MPLLAVEGGYVVREGRQRLHVVWWRSGRESAAVDPHAFRLALC